jgi:hypothetical protein
MVVARQKDANPAEQRVGGERRAAAASHG